MWICRQGGAVLLSASFFTAASCEVLSNSANSKCTLGKWGSMAIALRNCAMAPFVFPSLISSWASNLVHLRRIRRNQRQRQHRLAGKIGIGAVSGIKYFRICQEMLCATALLRQPRLQVAAGVIEPYQFQSHLVPLTSYPE